MVVSRGSPLNHPLQYNKLRVGTTSDCGIVVRKKQIGCFMEARDDAMSSRGTS